MFLKEFENLFSKLFWIEYLFSKLFWIETFFLLQYIKTITRLR